jgi:hypothetical protein
MARAAQKHMRATVQARQRKDDERRGDERQYDNSDDDRENDEDDDDNDEDDDVRGSEADVVNQFAFNGMDGEKRRRLTEDGEYMHPSSIHKYTPYATSPLSHPARKIEDVHDDSDVHRAGQALVTLQSTAPWSNSRSGSVAASPSMSMHHYSAAPQDGVENGDEQEEQQHTRYSYQQRRQMQSPYYAAANNMTTNHVPSSFASGHTSSTTAAPATGGTRSTAGEQAASLRSNSTGATPGRLREGGTEDGGGHVNVNGQPLWHGETVIGSTVFNQVSSNAEQADDMRTSGSDTIPANIQNAFNGLLYPMTDSFPFETIWSSGATFKQEVLPLLPSYKRGRAVLDAFKRFVRTASPGLLDSNMLVPALDFLCKKRRSPEERAKRELISLPWLASFLMIVAVGQESQRTCGSVPGEESEESEQEDGTDEDNEEGEGESSYESGAPTKAPRIPTPPKDMRKHCDLLLSATYQALRLCSFLGSPNLQTIYAQLLIGVYLLHTERASNAWPILGNVMRQAQSIGLHVEPSQRLSSEERELRRKLWWTIIQQDVLLSSIFGRPLAVSRFTCRITNETGNDSGRSSSYQEALCEFSVLARRHLNEDQEQEWDSEQVAGFKKELLSWYGALPSNLALNFSDSALERQTIRDQLGQRSSFAIQHSVDLCLQLQFALLSLFRNRLVIRETSQTGAMTQQHQQPRLDENSLRQCGRCVHNITLALSALIDLLGSLQAGMLWVRVFYAFHAGVTAAYLALSRTSISYGVQAREDLTSLTDVCSRLPDRFDGLKTVKATFGVLSKLVQVHAEQQLARKEGAPNAMRGFQHSLTSETPPRGAAASMSFSPSQLDDLLMANNITTPAFNIARDPTLAAGGVAPIFDLPQGSPSVGLFSSPTLGGGNVGAGAGLYGTRTPPGPGMTSSSANPSVTLDAAFPFSASMNSNVVSSSAAAAAAAAAAALPASRPDRGFPEPFGPMIAPPGPDASTSEIVSFWREFFALPFETSDLGLP